MLLVSGWWCWRLRWLLVFEGGVMCEVKGEAGEAGVPGFGGEGGGGLRGGNGRGVMWRMGR